ASRGAHARTRTHRTSRCVEHSRRATCVCSLLVQPTRLDRGRTHPQPARTRVRRCSPARRRDTFRLCPIPAGCRRTHQWRGSLGACFDRHDARLIAARTHRGDPRSAGDALASTTHSCRGGVCIALPIHDPARNDQRGSRTAAAAFASSGVADARDRQAARNTGHPNATGAPKAARTAGASSAARDTGTTHTSSRSHAMNKITLAKVLFSTVGLLLLADVHAQDLTGLWKAQQWFGPSARGPVLIERTPQGWTADFAGHVLPVQVRGSELQFALPGDAGEFAGRLDRNRIAGRWTTPPSRISGFRYASPVTLTADGADRWRGVVTPRDDTYTLFLVVQQRPDGTLGAYLRNPDRNDGVFNDVSQLVRDS